MIIQNPLKSIAENPRKALKNHTTSGTYRSVRNAKLTTAVLNHQTCKYKRLYVGAWDARRIEFRTCYTVTDV